MRRPEEGGRAGLQTGLPDTWQRKWDDYVRAHGDANPYQLHEWSEVISKAYGHTTIHLAAVIDKPRAGQNASKIQPMYSRARIIDLASETADHDASIAGVLSLAHLRHFLLGSSLTSFPFFDIGGVLANDEQCERLLLAEATDMARKLKADRLELRQAAELGWLEHRTRETIRAGSAAWQKSGRNKARMVVELPENSDDLMGSFRSKLRSQIKRPMKEGLQCAEGGLELLDDFYRVFSVNMRDLGSPVHSKSLIKNVLKVFPDLVRVFVVRSDTAPVAAGIVIGFRNTLWNPWASSLRDYAPLSPNMLLYWAMLRYGCDHGFRWFDFGRSTQGEGAYRFKEQWGARPLPLHWYTFFTKPADGKTATAARWRTAGEYWKRLPVPLTRVLGPRIRKYISL